MRRLALLLFVIVLCTSFLGVRLTAEEEPSAAELLKLGDTWFKEKTYKKAIDAYERFLKASPAHVEAFRVRMNLARCQMGLRQWWPAVKRLEAMVPGTKGGTPERAELLSVLGKLKGERWGGSKLVEGWLDEAAGLYKNLNRPKERTEALFALAHALCYSWDYGIDYAVWEGEHYRPNPDDVKVTWPEYQQQEQLKQDERRYKRVVATFREIIDADGGSGHDSARARYLLGSFHVNVLAGAFNANADYYPGRPPVDGKDAKKWEELYDRYTSELRRGIGIWKELLASNSGDSLADDAQYLSAMTLHRRVHDFPEAVSAYEKLLKDHAGTEWTDTAKSALQEIRKEEIRLNVPRVFLPGEKPELGLAARNVKEVRFTAYRLDLAGLLKGAYRFHKLEQIDVSNLSVHAEWTVKTGVADDHRGANLPLEVPFESAGAFLVHADGDRATCRALVLLSGVGMVSKATDDTLMLFSMDSVTGEPKAGVRYVVKATWRENRVLRSKLFGGTAGEDGLADIDLSSLGNLRPQLEIVGTVEDHVVTSSNSRSYPRGRDAHRVYAYTDRPVYRPNQTVNFRHLIRTSTGDGYTVFGKKPVRVQIQDPRGTKLYEKTLITNGNGAFSGSLTLGEEPPLGVYQVRTFIGGRQVYTNTWFRVEEYKKPEFEVTIDAGASRVKPGTPVKAAIAGRYYFGAPVSGGEVKYQIYRTPYRHWMPVKRRYGWYYRDLYPKPSAYWSRELVGEGSGLLGADGRLEVEFEAKKYKDEMDSVYRIEAQVTDASRREIRSAATLYATRQAFFVRTEVRRSLMKPGDSVEVTIRAEDANRKPVVSTGLLVLKKRVDREEEKDGEKVKVTDWVGVGDVPAKTDESGEGVASIVVDETGQFRLAYVTKGPDDSEITAHSHVWVVDRDFTGSQYRFSGVEVATDKDTYAIGDEIQVLVNSHIEDAWILLTVEADQRILHRRIVRANGRSHLEKLEVGEGWTPNVFVKALSVRDSSVFRNRRQVVVPPVAKFLDVQVVPAKEGTYLPGEEGVFTVTAKDATGEPVQGEFSLGFIDKSVLYIQPDVTPDIRQYFYGDKRQDRVRLASSFDFRYRGNEKAKSGHALVKYRVQRQPKYMNPWQYTFQGFRGDIQQQWGNLRQSLSGGGAKGGAPEGKARRSRGAMAPPAAEALGRKMKNENREESEKSDDFGADKSPANDGESGNGQEPEVKARKHFPDTAFWNAHVATGRDGKGEVRFAFPDSLTTWQATARGATAESAVGSATREFVTTKNLIMRLQAPRFFRERDELVVSGIVHNYFDEPLKVNAKIKVEGDCLELLKRGEFTEPSLSFTVAANGEQRIDWWFRVTRPGKAVISAVAVSDRETDAVQMAFPVYEYGAEKFIAISGSFTGPGGRPAEGGKAEMRFVIPEERHEDATELTVSVSPSLAGVLLESLPYLADYPYGCVEQTMSRFVPAVTVKKTLLDLGFTLEDLGVPKEREVPAGYWGRKEVQKLKVLRDDELARLVAQGVKRLRDFQHSDGSWGWWKESPPDLYMTSYVVRGLAMARRAGAKVDIQVLQKGAQYLFNQLKAVDPKEREEKGMRMRPDILASVASALLEASQLKGEPRALLDRIVDYLYKTRDELGATSRAMLAIALHRLDRGEEAGILCENLTDHALIDKGNGTCRFGRVSGYYRWSNDAVEATSMGLRAYLMVQPNSELITMMAKWLAANRRGAHWKSTKDTSHAVLALCDYLKVSEELTPDLTVTISVDGAVAKTIRITKENVFTADNLLTLKGSALAAGDRVVTVEAKGKGNLYFESHLTLFTREDPIKGAGNEVLVSRKAYRIHKRKRDVTRKVWVRDHYEERTVTEVYDEREPLESGAVLQVGDEVEIELNLTAKNDYRYLVFEDLKGAGFEPVELRSGHDWSGLLSYKELRDERVAFFVSSMKQGEHRMSYRLKAEIPGDYNLMPARGQAMYLPDVRGISDSLKLSITEPGVR